MNWIRIVNNTIPDGFTQPGKDMLTFGGVTLISRLMNLDLIDELHLMINPLVLGGRKALFKDVKERQSLKLIRAKPLKSGKVGLTYSTGS
jgi:dihydrofolate reductase